ncbi:MAG TPA: hypothetical protein VM306_39610 [Lentzea sp.]|nr:hypothetical protein [Lentzea sp.]HUQ61793.1 hypothetical protein [Lentzea sp.]
MSRPTVTKWRNRFGRPAGRAAAGPAPHDHRRGRRVGDHHHLGDDARGRHARMASHGVGAGPRGHFDPSGKRTVDDFRTPPTAERIVTNVGRGSPAGPLRGSAPPRACEPRPRALPGQALQTRG